MYALIFSMVVAFLTTFFITPYFIKFLRLARIVSIDLHKRNKPVLPSSGGICVAFGVLAGLLVFMGLQTFIQGVKTNASLLAVISSILIVTFVGLIDDINVKSKKVKTKDGMNVKIGIPQWIKPLITLPAAIPLMVISAGETTMAIPFIGEVDFNIFYPLVLIPIGVVGASNAINLLGGFNGSEAGMGVVYMFALGIYGLLHGSIGSVIFLISFASLLAFLKYNWYPAKILPGDSLTYLLGSLLATGVIVGNMEKIGVIVILPFIIEFFLKARAKFKATCLGKLRRDGKLAPPYGKKIYSLTHILMNLKPLTEKQVTILLILIEIVFSSIPFLGFI